MPLSCVIILWPVETSPSVKGRTAGITPKKCIHIRKSKTDAGIRTIPLSREAQQIIERQPHCSEYIFVNVHGNPFTASSLYKLNLQIQKRSGVAIATNHVYRHTFASRLIEAGKDPKSVARFMGHSKVEFTLNIYTQPDEMVIGDMDMLDNPLKSQSAGTMPLDQDVYALIATMAGSIGKTPQKFLVDMLLQNTKATAQTTIDPVFLPASH